MVNYLGFGEIIACDINLGNRLPKTSEKASLIVKKQNFTLPPMVPTNVYRAGQQALIGVNKESIYISWGNFGQFEINKQNTIHYQNANINSLPMFLLSEVMGIACWQKGLFAMHAGAVEISGKAHVFAASSGIGKSTTIASLWKHGATVLSDDLLLLDIKSEDILCIPTINEVKLWKNSLIGLEIELSNLKPSQEGTQKYILPTKHSGKKVPLKSINFIVDEPYDFQAPIELLKYFALPNQLLAGDKLKSHFEQSILLQKHCKMNQIRKMSSFTELKKWAKEFYYNNA